MLHVSCSWPVQEAVEAQDILLRGQTCKAVQTSHKVRGSFHLGMMYEVLLCLVMYSRAAANAPLLRCSCTMQPMSTFMHRDTSWYMHHLLALTTTSVQFRSITDSPC